MIVRRQWPAALAVAALAFLMSAVVAAALQSLDQEPELVAGGAGRQIAGAILPSRWRGCRRSSGRVSSRSRGRRPGCADERPFVVVLRPPAWTIGNTGSRSCARPSGRSGELAVVRARRALPHNLLGFVEENDPGLNDDVCEEEKSPAEWRARTIALCRLPAGLPRLRLWLEYGAPSRSSPHTPYPWSAGTDRLESVQR
jgi:hypothetical protein